MPEQEAATDAVIGRAFARSLGALVVVVAVAGGVWWLASREPEAEAPPELVTAAPVAAATATAIPTIAFRDVTAAAGIDFVHENGARGERLLPETMGGGVAFFDYDNDGDADLLLVNSTRWPASASAATPSATETDKPTPSRTSRLYRNRGNGTFDDVSADSGLDLDLYGMGAAIGDVDGDGYSDVFVTAMGANRLLRNVDGKRFVDVTADAGVAGADDAWSTCAAFFDYDHDGDLDLFVCNYVHWSRQIDIDIDYRLAGLGRAYGPPTNFAGTQPYLYRNDGRGRFDEVGEAAGVHVTNTASGGAVGKALAVRPVDVDGDGWLDLVVANDTVRNFYFRNRADGTFEELGARTGLAFDNAGNATGAMGIDAAAIATAGNGDTSNGRLALAIGNFAGEMTSFYVSQFAGSAPDGQASFTDEAIIVGIGPASRGALSFGTLFFDADLDGSVDLLQANGHIENDIALVQASQRYRQPAQLFWQCAAKDCARRFFEVPAAQLGDLPTPLVGRGAAYADIDGDGDLDVVITQTGGRAHLFRNDAAGGGRFVRVRVLGAAGSRESIGADVVLTAASGVTQRQTVMPTRSYLSQVELPVTFGLAPGDVPQSVTVTWPDGATRTVADIGAGRVHDVLHPTLVEGN